MSEAGCVLIAEDSPTQAEQLSHLLEGQGYAVTVAANGRQALEAARRLKPTLVITDVVMPEMDGYELCTAIRADATLKDTPVIILTSLSHMLEIAKSLECGADHFVRKPYEPQNLLSRVGYILANRELRRGRSAQMGLEIYFAGKKHFISSEREQILDLLLSSYEEAIKANEELSLRAAQLEAANKELESFSSSVSHDLRAPLRAIDAYSAILEESCAAKLDAEDLNGLARIRQGVQRMGRMVEDLLELSRVGRAPMRVVEIDMAALAREALGAAAAGFASPQCEIGELPPANGDPGLLRQLWVNLLSNSVKYSSGRAAPAIRVSGRREDKENVYCVSDNGAGFDMRYYEKLFGIFSRLHTAEEFPGTGIGLSIVQRVAARHGGRVWAEGKVDEGASFYFALPSAGGQRHAG